MRDGALCRLARFWATSSFAPTLSPGAGQMSMSPPLAMVRVRERGNPTVSEQTSTPKLTGQFSKALVYAELKHHNQVRKGGDIPYVGHLLTVAGLVINDGGSEAQAIAALLHDAVEDQGGPPTLDEIRANFGEDTLLVSVADKLDNARSMLRDYHTHGPSLWERFNRKNPQDHLWYYGELLKAYRNRGCTSWMVDELGRVVDELRRQVEGGDRVVLV